MTYTYPLLPENGWDVTAYPNGDLIEHEKERKLYSLFWEAEGPVKEDDDTGFVVAAEDLEDFFEEKLELLGLNFKEL